MDHQIKLKVDSAEVMNTEQPDTISIDGVEIPSWYFVWRKFFEYQRSIEHMKVFSLVQFVVIMALLLERLWR